MGRLDRTAGSARKGRVEFEAVVYHVLDRGDRREPIFGDKHPGVPKATATWERMSESDWSIL
jgi:hypothetical protein